jgi:hypothetical protein
MRLSLSATSFSRKAGAEAGLGSYILSLRLGEEEVLFLVEFGKRQILLHVLQLAKETPTILSSYIITQLFSGFSSAFCCFCEEG